MRQFHLNNEVVYKFQKLDVGYCDVYILDKYFDRLPESAKVGYFIYDLY